jgi:hypothetical protein
MRPEPRAIRRGKSRRFAHASHAMLLWKSEQFGWDSDQVGHMYRWSRPRILMMPATWPGMVFCQCHHRSKAENSI